MKILHLIHKSLKEQLRSYWLLLLSISMGPFFIFIYFLIIETWQPEYRILIVNQDQGVSAQNQPVNHGDHLKAYFESFFSDSLDMPFNIEMLQDLHQGIGKLKNKKADALILLPDSFSLALEKRKLDDRSCVSGLTFYGDLTSTNYLLSAVWANEVINAYTLEITGNRSIVEVNEIALGTSGSVTDFDIVVPGIMIVSLIMLMFTASIAFVTEVENKTILRLKLSKLTALGFVSGISVVQLLVGLVSALLTLSIAILLGFQYEGSMLKMMLILSLTTLSIIAFSLIIAAVTKSAGEVLVVGNFPMFLFMFFTGAAFPLKSNALFTVAGYPVTAQGLMTPTHAISALNKTLIMDLPLGSIIPELTAIVLLTLIYFITGALIFRKRHLN